MKYRIICTLVVLCMTLTVASCEKEKSSSAGTDNIYRVTYNGHSVADIDVYEYGLSGDYPVQHLSCRLYNGDYMNFRALPQTTTVKVHVEETFRMGWVQEVYRLASPLTKIEIDDGTQLGARP